MKTSSHPMQALCNPPPPRSQLAFQCTDSIPLPAVPPLPRRQRDEVMDVLQDLVYITRDGEDGYTHAAAHVHDRGLRDELGKFSRERRSMVAELENLMRFHLGKEPMPRQPGHADIHRAWLNIRVVVTEHDDQAILDEAVAGEETAESVYSAALDRPALPSGLRIAIRSLLEKVHRAHLRMLALQESGIYAKR